MKNWRMPKRRKRVVEIDQRWKRGKKMERECEKKENTLEMKTYEMKGKGKNNN